jgi:predicted dehydrogenase
MEEVKAPESRELTSLIGAGPAHFVDVIEGRAAPILTAEHATHVLEIMLKAEQSIESGCAIDLTTTF